MDAQRTPRKAIDALHAELLDCLIDIERKVEEIHDGIPAAKKNVSELVGYATEAFEEIRSRSIALVGYVKNKQIETMGSIEVAHDQIVNESHRMLGGFERLIWTGCALTAVNSLLLLGLVFFRQ